MTRIGAIEMASEANTRPQSVRNWPTNTLIASGTVFSRSSKMKISGKKKSFQTAMAVKMATIEIAGRTMGRTTWNRIRVSPAPSTRAASSISAGSTLHEIGEDEHRERNADRRIDEHQAGERIEQAEALHQREQFDRGEPDRQHDAGQEQAEHQAVPAEPVAAERERRHRRDQDGQRDRAAGHQQRIDEILAEMGAGPGVDEIGERPFERQAEPVAVDFRRGLEARDDQDPERQDDRCRPNQQQPPAGQPGQPAGQPGAAHGTTVRRSKKRSRSSVPALSSRKSSVPSASARPISVMPTAPSAPNASR